jgi:hypothetical protein
VGDSFAVCFAARAVRDGKLQAPPAGCIRMRWLVAAVLVSALLAGCSAKSAPQPEDALPDVDVRSTATTGVIRGVVVDVAIRPIAGVTLTVQAKERTLTTQSSATGSFGFQGLAPGTYFIEAHKLGYGDVRVAADVAAGEDAPRVTKIALEPDLATRPYVDAFVFKGFIECSVPAIALCSVPNVGAQIVGLLTCDEPLNQTGAPCVAPANATSDHFITWYAVARLPDWVQTEMVWTPTSAAGERLTLYHSYSGKEHIGIQGTYGSATGASPLLLTSDRAASAKIDLGNATDLAIRAFSGGMGQDPSGFVGASVEQEFTAYTHVFYGYLPPTGYRFSADGAPPPPT